MKMVKSLLLGTAAGLVAVAGAQAADLPVKAKPVQYVKICSLYGAGFYYIPGTDTCLKVGGFMRAEVNVNANGSFNPYRNQNLDSTQRNFQTFRTRGAFTLDARSQTEYGTLRSYALIAAMDTNGNSSTAIGGTPGGSPYALPYSNAAFIQFAGFTAGSTASFFDFDGQPYSNITPLWSSAQGGNGITVFAYTAQLGNGLSATISAEDPTNRSSNIGIGALTNTSALGGRKWPDVVANLRIDQAWGSAQVMGAIHDTYGVTTTTSGISSDQTGFAVGGGLKINLPMLGKGDAITAQATYAKGATNYLLVNSGGGGLTGNAISTGFPVVANTALGPVFDAVWTPGNASMDLTTGWDVTAGYEHNWVPGWKTSVYGSYGELRYSDAASAALSVQAGVVPGVGSANWNAFQIGSRTVWTPVANLDLSVDIVYTKYESAFAGQTGTAALGTFDDKGFFAGIFRAQRNFYP